MTVARPVPVQAAISGTVSANKLISVFLNPRGLAAVAVGCSISHVQSY